MKSFSSFTQIYLYRDMIDFRKGIYGLASIIQDELEISPFENYLFLFINSRRDRIKILYWDDTGFSLWYKILEKNRYHWPKDLSSNSLVISNKDLKQFLKGLNPWQQGHEKIFYDVA